MVVQFRICNMLDNKARMDTNKKLREKSTTFTTSSKLEKEVENKKLTLSVCSDLVDFELEAKSMMVLDLDFHNFDKCIIFPIGHILYLSKLLKS